MPSKAQLKARADFVKKYAKKKKGSKTKPLNPLSSRSLVPKRKEETKGIKSDSIKKMRSRQYEPLLVKALQTGFDIPRGWYDLTPAQKLKKLNYFMGRE